MKRTHRSRVGVLALRLLLAVAVVAVLATIAAGTVSYLLALAVVGGLAVALGGSGGPVTVLVLSLVGVVGAAGAAGGVLWGARRLDRALVAAATPPTPVERARRAYVRGEIDEWEFERRVERALAAERRR